VAEIGPVGAAQSSKLKTRVTLDSGAYSARKEGITIDMDAYIEFIHENAHLLDFYVNLDVIGDGKKSFDNWEYMRSMGLNPVPVWHYGTNVKYLYEYLRHANLVAISDFEKLSTKQRLHTLQRIWRNHLLDSVEFPKAEYHGLAVTAAELVKAFRWFSVDSSTWARKAGKYGKVCIPKGTLSAGYDYTKPPTNVLVSVESVYSRNHFDKWPTYKRQRILEYIESKGFKLGKGFPCDSDYEQGLCNHPTMRHQLNALFYLKMGQALGVRVYLAGNYDAFGKTPEVEKAIQQEVFAHGLDYCRMLSFYFNPGIQHCLDLKRKELNNVSKSCGCHKEAGSH
jgi:hypothetical protein